MSRLVSLGSISKISIYVASKYCNMITTLKILKTHETGYFDKTALMAVYLALCEPKVGQLYSPPGRIRSYEPSSEKRLAGGKEAAVSGHRLSLSSQ